MCTTCGALVSRPCQSASPYNAAHNTPSTTAVLQDPIEITNAANSYIMRNTDSKRRDKDSEGHR